MAAVIGDEVVDCDLFDKPSMNWVEFRGSTACDLEWADYARACLGLRSHWFRLLSPREIG